MSKRPRHKNITFGSGYSALVKQIQSELRELDFFIRRRTAESYWKVGKFIHEHLLENKDRADYGYNFYERLAEDVDRDTTTLSRTVQFYRTYPILAGQQELSWHHYKRLITIKDESRRKLFEERAAKKGWNCGQLAEAIRLDRLRIEEPDKKPAQAPVKLSATRSRLFTYKVLEPSYVHPIEEWITIDLGFYFHITTEIKGLRLKAGDLIESIKSGNTYSFKHSEAKPKELYTYKALVERVVDADTYWLNMDLGFSCWFRHKIRLRGIDAPELSTKDGQEAKKFVESRLKEVAFVVVKIHKDDKYGRYLTDIFYLPTPKLRQAGLKTETEPQKVLEEGTFLNQELLDLGLAVVMDV